MAAKFVAEEGELKGTVINLGEGKEEWAVGRDSHACDVVVEDPAVSRVHFVCRAAADGVLTVSNKSAVNPLEVNGESIEGDKALQHGDMVKVGNSFFRYYADDQVHVDNDEVAVEPPPPHDDDDAEQQKGQEEETGQEEEKTEQKKETGQEEEKTEQKEETGQEEEKTEQKEETGQEEEEEESSKEETAMTAVRQQSDMTAEAAEEVYPTQNDITAPTTTHKYTAQPLPVKEEEETMEEEQMRDTIYDDEVPPEKNLLAEINFDMLHTGRWLLKVIGGPNNGAEFSMTADTSYLIGTDPNSCDVVFHDTSVSRQHARLTVNKDESLAIEDLGSRNGTLVDGHPLKGKEELKTNVVVTMGTTSFVVYDREGEMQTIISPLLPSIVKVLKEGEEAKSSEPDEDEEKKKKEAAAAAAAAAKAQEEAKLAAAREQRLKKEKGRAALTTFAMTALGTLMLAGASYGIYNLFKPTQPVEKQVVVDANKLLKDALAPFPDVQYSFNKATGKLLLVGHILRSTDRDRMEYSLQGLNFIHSLDDSNVVIDEYVTREVNPLLARNPNWRGVTIQTPKAGQFILTGTIQNRTQAERLSEYISFNFPYLSLLEKRIIVEEDLIDNAKSQLRKVGIRDMDVKLANGELTLTGGIPRGKEAIFDELVADFKTIPGIREVKAFTTTMSPEATLVNVSDKYRVTGFSSRGGSNFNVVINGRILTTGDILDGMTITTIKPNLIELEKDGIRYRIDF